MCDLFSISGVWGGDICICMRVFLGVGGLNVCVVAKLSASTVKRDFCMQYLLSITVQIRDINFTVHKPDRTCIRFCVYEI